MKKKLSVFQFLMEQVEGEAKKSRLDFLREKYVDTGRLTLEQLMEIVNVDPTSKGEGTNIKVGSYTQWIINQYLKLFPKEYWEKDEKNPEKRKKELSKNEKREVEHFWEDLYKLKDWLDLYNRQKGSLKDASKRDINKVTDMKELVMLWKELHERKRDSGSEKKAKKEFAKVNGIDYLYSDDKYDIVSPKTWIASKLVAGYPTSQWCTARLGEDNYFNSYTSNGQRLYIVRDLNRVVPKGQPGEGQPQPVYQFQLSKPEIKDEMNHSFNVTEFFKANPGIATFFKPLYEAQLKSTKDRDVLADTLFRTYVAVWGMDNNTRKMVEEMFVGAIQKTDTINVTKDNYSNYVELLGVTKLVHLTLEHGNAEKTVQMTLEFPNSTEVFDIPETLCRFTNLNMLSLSGFVRSLPKCIGNLKEISMLNLNNNPQLKQLPENAFPNVHICNISGSSIKKYPKNIQDKLDSGDLFLVND